MYDPDFYHAWRLEKIANPGDGGIYVHVPFCVRRCRYCAFVSSVWRDVPATGFAQNICREFDQRVKECGFTHLKTLYFGGGTPTMLCDDALETIVSHCVHAFGLPCEMTLEVNPEHVTRERANRWKSMGFTRVSMGSQSFDVATLELLGRRHSPQQIRDAVDILHSAGIPEISLDLIYGACTDADPMQRWLHELSETRALQPEHVSCYELTLEENTPLWTMQRRGRQIMCDEDTRIDMMQAIPDRLEMRQYEISNYSREGYFSAHNVSCWGGLPYLGLGPGAHSFRRSDTGFVRRANSSNVRRWMQDFAENRIPEPEFEETLSPETHYYERLICAARTRFWWSPDDIANQIGTKADAVRPALQTAVHRGLLECDNAGRYTTTDDGIRLNNLLDELIFA